MNNKGFTLLELVLAMSISAIVIVCIAVYSSTGIKEFRNARTETMSQIECEAVASNIENKLKVASKYRVLENSERYVIDMISGIMDESKAYKNVNYIYVLDKTTNHIYLINNGESNDYINNEYESLNISFDKNNTLSNYIESINIYPNSSAEAENGYVNIFVKSTVVNMSCVQQTKIRIRNNIE